MTSQPALEAFLTQSQTLAARLNSTTAHPQAAGDPIPHGALQTLLSALNAQPEPIRPALFAWLLLRATYSAARARELFDELQLRTGLAQTFAAFDLHGEQGWRAAAQVRLLLLTDTTPLPHTLIQDTFWSSPDTHWLAGIDPTSHYVNQESFESLLPLLAFPTSTPPTQITTMATQTKTAAYNIPTLRAALSRSKESAAHS